MVAVGDEVAPDCRDSTRTTPATAATNTSTAATIASRSDGARRGRRE